MSPSVSKYYDLALSHRYGNYEGLNLSERKYTGNRYVAQMEARAIDDACRLFHAGACDFRALSGHIAGCSVILGSCSPGDLVLELDEAAGGHRLAGKLLKARTVRLEVEPVPFDGEEHQVDVKATVEKISNRKPRLVILGSSNYLYPTPFAEIAEACREVGALLMLDAAHVMGLIAGGQFPQPFDAGVDIVVSSTHKTLAGPQGGMILARNKEILARIVPALYPGLVTNHHLMRIPALVILFAEWRRHGRGYAEAIVANAVGLAEHLAAVSIPVVTTSQGPTRSHTLLIKTAELGATAQALERRLEDAGIMTGARRLPEEHGGEGLRIGLQEVTRKGLSANHLPELASLLNRALTEENPGSLRPLVKSFTRTLDRFHYCDGDE
jgi:glycine hydroxymethyltransferase